MDHSKKYPYYLGELSVLRVVGLAISIFDIYKFISRLYHRQGHIQSFRSTCEKTDAIYKPGSQSWVFGLF
jgi:hypothetical protein